jgi:RHH-type proline utilization regulon transcriptional repressor/proline dehydrogenase/delta 1-pyrroline-5-carboxylate dehydrogenase
MSSPDAREEEIEKMGHELWEKMKGEVPGVFNKDFWQGKILDWAMQDPGFKVDMFRFVDVLPVLHSSDQVARHIKEYLLKEGRELPMVISAALKAASGGLTAGLGAKAIRKNVTDMAERFIVGHNAKEAMPILRKLHKGGIAFTVDLLGEATVSDGEADAYRDRYLDLIDNLADEAAKWAPDPVIDENHLGPIPRTNVSLKISAMESQLDAADVAGSVAALKRRVLPLFLRAKEKNVFLNVDLESWDVKGITYDLFEEILAHPELKGWPHLGIVVQAYLKSAPQDLDRLLSLAKNRGAPITIRLVKGAYWDYEVVHAKQHGLPCPVLTDKAATDAQYERLTDVLLSHTDHLLPAIGSHNLRSVANALVLAKAKGIPEKALEVQMLYGMAEPERKTIRGMGHRVRVYAPVGEMLPGMAYLVRRLLENTSNSGFLKLSHHDNADLGVLLKKPDVGQGMRFESPMASDDLRTPFDSCPFLDFTDGDVRDRFQNAVTAEATALPYVVPVQVADSTRDDGEHLDVPCPSRTDRLAARVTLATVEEADRAVAACMASFAAWRDKPLKERCALLAKLGERLQADRHRLAAMQTWEEAKPWRQADADVAEAVDFCHYYARQGLQELGPQKMGNVFGEDNVLFYEGRGPCVVIAPWNFPLAILCGMTTAALVAGNPVIMKPAEQSSGVAHALYQHMIEAGFPKEVVHLLPGIGETVGAHLVAHPDVAQIAFTGSKAVGLAIQQQAALRKDGQAQVKRVVCEMGGKNATIVDDDADLDEAVAGVVYAAFGYSGQKCSATSRVLVVGSAYEAFVGRLVEATRSMQLAGAEDPACRMGPVIDADAHRRLLGIIENPGEGATRHFVGEAPAGGYFVPPAIFGVDDPNHRLMQEEFFGPIVAVMKVDSFDQALEIANGTEYALTGAVFSRSPANLEKARTGFKVGNLYLNRNSTGAMVMRQPFGGFGMSGAGLKAGGPGYLLQFANPRCITENTMRRGFTPDVEM